MTHRNFLLGFDVGSSSVKASLVDIESGECAASAFYPSEEAPIKALKTGWAEQDPEMWWANAKLSLADPYFDVVARAAVQIKNAIDATIKLGGINCMGKQFEEGKLNLEQLVDYAKQNGEPQITSGKQEKYETIVALYAK